ncbi:MAG: glycoside hydrolase family 99-like domain-containing protein [Rhodocyclaceae bacterium]
MTSPAVHLDTSVCLDMPAHVSPPYGWVGHIPFAFHIVGALRPRCLVELGTHSGNSYLALCQAVSRLRLETRCYAVDSWQGDAHAGSYADDVFKTLKAYHDPHYGSFSTLMPCLFDQALAGFDNGGIDLLHIDGLHTEEAVTHDFDSWLPKMSTTGVILLHDTTVQRDGFGVHRLMAKLRARYPVIEFTHCNGLGVVYVGTAPMPDALRALFDTDAATLRRVFARLGHALESAADICQPRGAPLSLDETTDSARGHAHAVAQLTHLRGELEHEIAARDYLLSQADAAQQRAAIAQQQADVALRQALSAHEDALAQHAQTHVRVMELEAQRGDMQTGIAHLLDEGARLRRAIDERDARMAALQASTSWRMTAPLRAARTTLRRVSVKRMSARLAKQCFRALPLAPATRTALKDAVFTRTELFANTQAYRNWQAQRSATAPEQPVADGNVVTEDHDRYGRMYVSLFNRARGIKRGVSVEYVPLAADSLAGREFDLRLIAFYLPQFHPFTENDAWWGRGFTEWTNVSKSVPQFEDHYQPHLPGELGFYDLRVPDVMRRQVELARQYGISGFCFHYYWFAGKRLMERPLDHYLAHAELDLPFCICWANENWSRRWDGSENELLISQTHTPESDESFIADVAPMFADDRYIRVDDRPVLIVYRIALLPDPKATTDRWRAYCRSHGMGEIYLVAAQSFDITDPRPYGCDAAVEFPPHQIHVGEISTQLSMLNGAFEGKVYDFRELARGYCAKPTTDYVLHRTVCPSWDNEARRPGRGHAFHHASPAEYAKWLGFACRQAAERHAPDERLVFVNAWNEWAEGAHLEPDRRFGYAYLHATANVMREHISNCSEVEAVVAASQTAFHQRSDVAVLAHLYYVDLVDVLADAIDASALRPDVFVSVRADITEQELARVRTRLPQAYLVRLRNRGRDMYPLLHLLPQLLAHDYSAVCKVHGKKSLHLRDGDGWRERLFAELLAPEVAAAAASRFRHDARLGLSFPDWARTALAEPDRHVLNVGWLSTLLPRLGAGHRVGLFDFDFVAGSMYWFRPHALAPLLNLKLAEGDFEMELGQIDGTLAHALERLTILCAHQAGYADEALGAPAEACPG